jgi:hypothetical protein
MARPDYKTLDSSAHRVSGISKRLLSSILVLVFVTAGILVVPLSQPVNAQWCYGGFCPCWYFGKSGSQTTARWGNTAVITNPTLTRPAWGTPIEMGDVVVTGNRPSGLYLGTNTVVAGSNTQVESRGCWFEPGITDHEVLELYKGWLLDRVKDIDPDRIELMHPQAVTSWRGTEYLVQTVPIDGWVKYPYSSDYRRLTAPLSWTDALEQAADWGAQLIHLYGAYEEAWLIEQFGDQPIYIGLHRESEGIWRWPSGWSTPYYRNWCAGEPSDSGTVAAMNTGEGGCWSALDGASPLPAVVETPGRPLLVTLLEGGLDITHHTGTEVSLDPYEAVLITWTELGEKYTIDPASIDRWWEVLVISVASPANLLVTDPQGHRIGVDANGQIVNEISGSWYSGPTDDLEEIVIEQPIDGEYDIVVRGTGHGDYALEIQLAGVVDQAELTEHSGTITLGQEVLYTTTVDTGADIIPPTTTLALTPAIPDGLEGWYVSPVEVTLTAEDDPGGTGVAATEFRLFGGDWQPYTDPFTLTDDGVILVEARSIDHAGNIEDPPRSVTVKLDRTAPNVSIITPQSGVAVQGNVTFSISANDATSGIETVHLTLRADDGQDGTPIGHESLPATLDPLTGHWEHTFDTTTLTDGPFLLAATATDQAGNTATSDSIPFSVHNTLIVDGWEVVELLPATPAHRAGRTMPVRFTLRVMAEIDEAQPFIHNEDLIIKIREAGGAVLHTAEYGTHATDYRIDLDDQHYITNFRTLRQPAHYTVEVWWSNDVLIGSFEFITTD